MTDPASSSDRRAQHVAAFGLILQVVLCALLWAMARMARSDAIAVVARLAVIGVPIWLILLLVFHQLRRVSAEALETAELLRAREAGADEGLFELDDEALLLEQNRLRWMVQWLLPAVTVVVALYLIVGNFVAWGWTFETVFEKEILSRTQQPTLMMWVVVAVGFSSFLSGRYASALARLPQWRVMRAGATVMTGNAIACLGLAIALMATGTIEWAEPLFVYLLRAALFILGIEFALNFILDLYRPKTPGEIPRPSFDSRLLGLVTEPGGIAKSIAEAVNYQFGFEVSKTWFYQLLQRWLLPIVAVTVLAVVLLTSVVVVDADEVLVVEHFGRLVHREPDALGPGLHLKWPYPIDVVRRAPVKRVGELVIGEATAEDKDPNKAIIWTEQHEFVPELMLLVAASTERKIDAARTGTASGDGESESVPVSLLMVSVPIQYRVKNVHDFLYNYDDPVKLLEEVAYQHLQDFAAGVDIDRLMGPERKEFNLAFHKLLQERLDELGVGIEVVFVGVRGAHPPATEKVAEAFQGVIRAETAKYATINAAEGEARRTLIQVAGTEARAAALDEAILERSRLQQESADKVEVLGVARQRVNDLLLGNPMEGIPPLSGQAAAVIADARASASTRISEAVAKVRTFATAVAAYQAAPELYMQRKRFELYEDLGYIRRYLIAGDPSKVIVVYETKQEGALDRVLAEGLEEEKR